jgi:NADH-quinone oxidoreductase subunit M
VSLFFYSVIEKIMILTWLVILPALGGLLAWIVSRWSTLAARWISLLACAAVFVISVGIWVSSPGALSMARPVLDQRASWVIPLGITYHLAMDGLSLLLVILTGLLGIMSVAISWREIDQKVGAFHFLLLLLLTGIIGVFLAFDLFLFYFFWELMLVPMYFLIGILGHVNRIYAAVKFFLFTFISGLAMLVAILGLYSAHGQSTGVYTFDYPALLRTPLSPTLAFWLMLGFFIGFAVKLPAFPVHSWLPDAHTEAPTAGSVILAGIMLKTGAYGFFRFAIPLFPGAASAFTQVAMILGVIGILYGAMLAFAQSDFKRLVAYTSVSHLGYVLLGVYAGTTLALQGAVMTMIAHGLSTGALFMMAGIIQERTHTREFGKLGGLWAIVPKMGGFTLFFALAALGLPGMADFVGEFLVLLGTFQVNPVLAMIGTLGFIVSVIYALKLVQDSMQGPNRNQWKIPDLNLREAVSLGALAVLILWLGLHPQPIFNTARASLGLVERSLSSAVSAGTTRVTEVMQKQ